VDDGGTVDGSLFEGIARALQPEGTFAEELRAIGFDVHAPKLRYPYSVMAATLDVAHRHLYPDLSREDAHRRVGQRMVDTFFVTILGKVVRTLFQVLGPERFLARLPKLASMGTTGLELRAERPAPGEVRLFFRAKLLDADFIAGAMEGLLRHSAEGTRVVIAPGGGPTAFELRVTGLR
jgi:uncharacterized protein (TIGR02265 family)